MSETEKDLIKKMSALVTEIPESKKEYLLGLVDGMALVKEDGKKEDTTIERT